MKVGENPDTLSFGGEKEERIGQTKSFIANSYIFLYDLRNSVVQLPHFTSKWLTDQKEELTLLSSNICQWQSILMCYILVHREYEKYEGIWEIKEK